MKREKSDLKSGWLLSHCQNRLFSVFDCKKQHGAFKKNFFTSVSSNSKLKESLSAAWWREFVAEMKKRVASYWRRRHAFVASVLIMELSRHHCRVAGAGAWKPPTTNMNETLSHRRPTWSYAFLHYQYCFVAWIKIEEIQCPLDWKQGRELF